jgi:hypothetical protein
VVFCGPHCIEVKFLWFSEYWTGGVTNYTAGIEVDGNHINVNNTTVDQNYDGLEVDSDSSTISVMNFSHVCNNIDLNYGNGFISIDGASTACGA